MKGWHVATIWSLAAAVIAAIVGWHDLVAWLEAHDKLAGWAQFAGAMIALGTAVYLPVRARQDQRRDARAAAVFYGARLAATVAVLHDQARDGPLSAARAAVTVAADVCAQSHVLAPGLLSAEAYAVVMTMHNATNHFCERLKQPDATWDKQTLVADAQELRDVLRSLQRELAGSPK